MQRLPLRNMRRGGPLLVHIGLPPTAPPPGPCGTQAAVMTAAAAAPKAAHTDSSSPTAAGCCAHFATWHLFDAVRWKSTSSTEAQDSNDTTAANSSSSSSNGCSDSSGRMRGSRPDGEIDIWQSLAEVEKMSQTAIRPMTLMRLLSIQNDSPEARIRT